MYKEEAIVISSLHHKTHVAELWHGETGSYRDLCRQEQLLPDLAQVLLDVKERLAQQKLHALEAPINIAMPAAELIFPAAALMAQQQGLHLHLAICGTTAENPAGQFLRTGHLPAAQSAQMGQAAGVILRFIGAPEQAQAAEERKEVSLTPEQLNELRAVIGVDFVNDSRADNYMSKIYESTQYVLHPQTARVYNALQDYRVMWAESTPSVILALESPEKAETHIRQVLQLPHERALTQVMAEGRKRFEEY